MPDASTRNKVARRVPPDVWKQMLAPVRAEIIEVMRALGTATIKEVASVLSRVPASLYAHVDRLVALGVLVEQEPRRLPRHTERVFALAARDFVPDVGGADATAIGEIATTTAVGITNSAVRTLRTAARARRLQVTGPNPNHGIIHEVVWLSHEELAELRISLRRLKRLADSRKAPDGREPHLLIAMYMPIAGSARHREGAAEQNTTAISRNRSTHRTRRSRTSE
jgi:hypothetical protein